MESPKSVLAKGVVEVGLLGPYDSEFKNPLPAERDDDCKYGVFVRTDTPIKFCGEKEWAMMNVSMLSDPSIAEEA